MRRLLSLFAAALPLCAGVEIKGHVDLQSDTFLIRPAQKHADDYTLLGNVSAEYTDGAVRGVMQLNAQQDYYDLQGRTEQNGRSFVRLDELYGSYAFGDEQIMIGRNIRFWGALEARNIVDGFNPTDFRSGLFENDKMGVWNAAWTHYTETGSFSLIVKTDEQDQPMGKPPYVYYFFPSYVTYDSALKTEESRYRPSVYLRYSGSTETEYPLDYAVIVQHGYDSQRYFLPGDPVITTTGLLSYTYTVPLTEHAYLVNKVMTYDTLVAGNALFKLEALYTDVIKDAHVSDYYHVAGGVEYTLPQVYNDTDLGLLAEYYRYGTTEKGKLTDLELFEVFQNDLFLGLRVSLNDVNSASLVGGAILDMEYNEQSYYAEYETRLFERFKLNLDYRYIEPSKHTVTAFSMLGRFQSITAKLGFYF